MTALTVQAQTSNGQLATNPAGATARSEEKSYAAKLEQAALLVSQKQFAQAQSLLGEVLLHYNQTFREEKTLVYSSRDPKETFAYVLEAATSKDEPKLSAKVYSNVWGDAYFLRGYILVEQNRLNLARGALQSAVALGPRNAQYLNELGQLYLRDRDWSTALRVFDRAENAAKEFSPETLKTNELTLAWRGKGYALIELGRLDEATALYRQNLELVKDQPQAISQLRYIDTLKARQQQSAVQQQAAGTSLAQLNALNFAQLWQLAESQNSTNPAAAYLRSIGSGQLFTSNGVTRAVSHPKERAIAECVTAIAPSPDKVRLLFAVDQEGSVQRSWTDQTGFVDQCVTSKNFSAKVPVPPTSLHLLCSTFEKIGENKTQITGCGKHQWLEICESKGTVQNCTFQLK